MKATDSRARLGTSLSAPGTVGAKRVCDVHGTGVASRRDLDRVVVEWIERTPRGHFGPARGYAGSLEMPHATFSCTGFRGRRPRPGGVADPAPRRWIDDVRNRAESRESCVGPRLFEPGRAGERRCTPS